MNEKDMKNKKVLLGMSGGIDSTYAVLRLKELGCQVEGAVLKMFENTDIEAAQRAADALGVKLHIIDCTEDFSECVIGNFVSEYCAARTPNPCVVCNREVKFKKLCDYARENSFDNVSTGHYAHIKQNAENGRYCISRGIDSRKDQSYVLWRLSQEELEMLFFPLAADVKTDVKNISKELELPSAESKESQEICFIPSNDHFSYIEELLGKKFPEGDFIDSKGNVLGKHKGVPKYTIGQRKGLGISLGRHAFVTHIDPDNNTVTLGDEEELFKTEFNISDLVFQKYVLKDGESARLSVKVRYAAKPVLCSATVHGNGAHIVLDEPARAITPGQSAVFYDGDDVVFGGFID